jgi:hypothetical protein
LGRGELRFSLFFGNGIGFNGDGIGFNRDGIGFNRDGKLKGKGDTP